jgi:predicted amidohydrolase YtcJ
MLIMFLKFSSLSIAIALLVAACVDTSDGPASMNPADAVLVNGRIYTMSAEQPSVEALAISDGKIVAIGDTAAIESLAGSAATRVDLQGWTVMPGLFDLHVHPVFAGIQASRCVIPQGAALSEIQARVKACVDAAEPDEWITGGQWDSSAIGQIPTREMLDVVSPDNPVFLGDTSEHSFWANSRALETAGVTADTPDPFDGILERDADGVPTGVLRESAAMLVRQHIPEETDEQVRAALTWGLDEMLAHGITSFTEAWAGYSTNPHKELATYAALADSGELKQRVRLCLPWSPEEPQWDVVIEGRDQYNRERLTADCIKISLDGVPTDSHTAAMLEPYAGTVEGRDDEASRYGLLSIEQAILDEAVTRFDVMGLTVKFHTAGDAAVRSGLDAIEAARKANGPNEQRHNVGHCTFVAASDMGRGIELGATFEMSPYLWSPSPISDSIAAAVGEEREKVVWPIRDTVDSGSLVVPGSDWSVVPSVNPWIGIETMVTREMPGGSDRSFGKTQAVSLDEALEIFTVNSARQMGMENQLGRLEAGYLADLIVLDRDPYAVPATELHQVTVVKTMIDGEIVYEKAE